MSLVKQIAIESEGVTTNYDIGVNVANVDGLGAPTTSRAGLVPVLPNDGLTNKYLRQDGTWAEASQDLSNYIQKSVTEGLVKNDGTIDTNKYVVLKSKCLLNGTVSNKTQYGEDITKPYGNYIQTDGENTYYSDGEGHQVLNKATSTQVEKTQITEYDFDGEAVWTDGDNIYLSANDNQYVLNKATSTWTEKTWYGLDPFGPEYIQKDGDHIYYSKGSEQYELNKATSTQTAKSQYDYEGIPFYDFYAVDIQTDGENIYYSDGTSHQILDKTTGLQNEKTQSGLTNFIADYIQSDGTNVYYSDNSTQYVLDKSNDTQNVKTQSGIGVNGFYSKRVQTDGEHFYASAGNNYQYIFDGDRVYPNSTIGSDGTIIMTLPEIFMLTGTLAAAATSVSITDSRLGANTFILGPNTSTGIAPTAITVNDSTHTQTATFAAPESAVTVAIVCFNFSS